MRRWLALRKSSKLLIVVLVLYLLFAVLLPLDAVRYGYWLVIYIVVTMIWQRTHQEPPAKPSE